MTRALQVLPTAEARDHLSETLRRFRSEGAKAAPMVFGVHRKPEAAVIPFSLYEQLMDIIDDVAIVEEVEPRLKESENLIGWKAGLEEYGIDPSTFE